MVTRAGESGGRRLVAKFFSTVSRRRMRVHAAADEPARVAHWVLIRQAAPFHRVALCDAYTLEAAISALVCDRSSCWHHHAPVLLEAFVHAGRDEGVLVSTHEGTPLHHWLATATTAQVQLVVFQVAALLHALQRHLCFTHNDLHDFNVLITTSRPVGPPSPTWQRYIIGNMTFTIPFADGLCARIIDFQFASLLLRPSGVQVVRADAFVEMQERSGAWNPYLQGCFGSDLGTLLRCMRRTLPRGHSAQPFLRHCINALDNPRAGRPSRVKPCVFLQRVFCGVGPHAAVNFTTPPPATVAVVERLRCDHHL